MRLPGKLVVAALVNPRDAMPRSFSWDSDVDTGVDVVDASNVDQFLKK